jgi:hypothetical protein
MEEETFEKRRKKVRIAVHSFLKIGAVVAALIPSLSPPPTNIGTLAKLGIIAITFALLAIATRD